MRNLFLGLTLVILAGIFVFVFSQNRNSQQDPQQSKQQKTAQSIDATGAPTTCTGNAIPQLTEGPYYTPNTPERQDITEEDTVGESLILEGYVYDLECKPIANAWIDFWQADGAGNYDNEGFNLRGHQYTDDNGYYRLETVLPTRYTGRTEHIHFKIRASENSKTVTSQLFFPNSETNETDSIFNDALVVTMGEKTNGTNRAFYNFVIER